MAARSFIRVVGTGNIYNESDEFMAGQSTWFDGPADKIPAGWLIKNGAAISRTTYATLFAVIGTMYGPGDGATTFNLPDDRGEFTRGLDMGRGVDSGRVQGSAQGDAIRNITGKWGNAILRGPEGVTGAFAGAGAPASSVGTAGSGGSGSGFAFDASLVVPTANENRPRNRASIPIIKYS